MRYINTTFLRKGQKGRLIKSCDSRPEVNMFYSTRMEKFATIQNARAVQNHFGEFEIHIITSRWIIRFGNKVLCTGNVLITSQDGNHVKRASFDLFTEAENGRVTDHGKIRSNIFFGESIKFYNFFETM